MTPEAQRICISKACGWTRCVCGDPECGAWFAPSADPNDPSLGPPDYLTDLNACHVMEESLTEDELNRYADILCDMVAEGDPDPNICGLITLTAAQRAEAFLRAKGLWTTSPS